MMRTVLVLLSASAMAACAGSFKRAEPESFSLVVTDVPSQQRFDVVLTSKATKPICLSKESWPAEDGTFPMGYDGAVLTTTKGSLQPKAAMTAYCPGGCGEVRIEPGKEVRGKIAYAAFGEAATVAADSSRSLMFPVYPYYCTTE